MNDNIPKKINPAVIAQLNSGNEDKILTAITSLRDAGNSQYMPDLLSLLRNTVFDVVKHEVCQLLIDLKDKSALPYLIDAIEDQEFLSIRKLLLSCCWQSGFDFKDYLSFFVDQVIVNDWETAFEAFTIIENLEQLPETDILEGEIRKINRAIQTATGNKTYLLTELRALLA